MIVMGSMIGSGVFIVSADIARNVGGAGLLLAVWGLTAVLTLIAAISYGELAGMFPEAGGQYVYLREAYGTMVAFLYGWAFFAIIQTGTIAAVGVAFAKFAAYLLPAWGEKTILVQAGWFKITAAQLVSIATIVLLTAINARGIQNGRIIQLIFTITKIAALAILFVLGFALGFKADIWQANWADAWQFGRWSMEGGAAQMIPQTGWWALIVAIAVSSVGSLFSMDAWNNVAAVAGEIRNPQRNISRSLFLGTLSVGIIFLLTNVMYTAALPISEIAFAKDDRVGIAVARSFMGEAGVIAIALMIMISTFGCNNGLILAGARVYYSMALDGLFFKKAAQLNSASVPGYALWAQCIWASALCLTGRYGDLLDYVIFTVLIFYVLTIGGIFVLRRTRPDWPRPSRAVGYPVLPALYIVLATSIALILLAYKPNYSWPGLGLTLLGVPLFFLIKGGKK